MIKDHNTTFIQDPEFEHIYIDYHRESLIEPARTRGFGSDSGRRLSDLELLAKLQQFGAATGLLDFSWSPLVALWFASEDSPPEESPSDGKLFLVNTNDAIRVARVSSAEADQQVRGLFSGGNRPPDLSFWEPTAAGDASARILRQRSVFILGRPLLPDCTHLMPEMVVPQEDKEPLRQELKILDVDEESIFTDVYAFAESSTRRPVPPLTAEVYIKRGNRYYQQGDYAEAMAAYSESLDLAPDELTYLLRGNVRAASGNHHEAIEDYDQAVARIDEIHQWIQDTVYFNRGNSRAELGEYEAAVPDFTEAIKRNPEVPHVYYNRGNAYLDLYRFEDAIHDYERVTGDSSQNAAFNMGNALVAMGRLGEAQR